MQNLNKLNNTSKKTRRIRAENMRRHSINENMQRHGPNDVTIAATDFPFGNRSRNMNIRTRAVIKIIFL